MFAVAADALHRRRVRPDHVQHDRRVVLHHAVGVVGAVLPLHAAGYGATDKATVVGAHHVCRHLCVPDCGAVLCGTVRGRHGRSDHAAGRARLLCGRCVEEQTDLVHGRRG